MPAEPLIEASGVAVGYGTGPVAVTEVSFRLEAGERLALLGPNGGGKTTLFRVLSTMLEPTSGSARVLGFDVQKRGSEVRRQLGVAFQSPSLDLKLTVEENLLHQGHLYGLHGPKLRFRIQECLERVDLLDRAGDFVESLSGGMFRRVELAKTLLHRPAVLLLDEPSTGLDPGARHDVWQYLRSLRASQESTIVFTTHLMDEAAESDRIALIHQGAIVALGSPDLLTAEIGGDVITVHTQDPSLLIAEIRRRFSVTPVAVDGLVHIECREGHRFIPQLVEALPGHIQAISLGKPTLEDVFIHRTGHRLWNKE